MKRILISALLLVLLLPSCNKNDRIDDPQILEFSASPTTLPRRDTVTFKINAIGDNITFFNGKSIISLNDTVMPYTHVINKIRFNVSDTADTVWARLDVVNIYSADLIKEVSDSIQLILLNQ